MYRVSNGKDHLSLTGTDAMTKFELRTKSWLMVLVAEYYGAAYCLCMVCLSSEKSIVTGVLWSLGFCLLGNHPQPPTV